MPRNSPQMARMAVSLRISPFHREMLPILRTFLAEGPPGTMAVSNPTLSPQAKGS
jgi:hypothetical protein